MKIILDDIKSIELCYENGTGPTILREQLIGLVVKRKTRSPYQNKGKPCFYIKTFEIVVGDPNYQLGTDLAQLTLNYTNNDFDHFFIVWGDNDCTWDCSSLQEVHKSDAHVSLTSNCNSTY